MKKNEITIVFISNKNLGSLLDFLNPAIKKNLKFFYRVEKDLKSESIIG